MTDFLLELRSEEIPARMQLKAKEDLARLFHDALAKAGLAAASVETFATPRRLALIATGLPLATEAVSEETKGPKVGAPPQAMEGFLRKTGLSQDQLVERDGVYYAVVEKAGRQTADVLAEAIPAIIRAFPWPKSQRWGAASVSTESLRWVRPLQGIVALLGDAVVHCEIEGIVSGAETLGHRFHHSGAITIGNAGDYIEKLRAAYVLVHFSERCRIIRDGAKAAAEAAGLNLVEDEGLVIENAGLTEWPVPMLGRFDPAFLDVPQEVIQLTARVNQKYFVCHDAAGRLANAFVCTANIDAHDKGAAIVAGNEKVLAARLSDAKFFWEQDLKVALDDQAQKLAQITFHEKLGSVADKVERVAKLARWLVEDGIVNSSPERGGGARAASDGGGSLPPASFDAESPLQYPSDGPPPRAGEDLAYQAERAAKPARWLMEKGIVGPRSPAQAGAQPATNESSDAVLDPGLRRGIQDLDGAPNPNVIPAKAGGQLRSEPLESTGQEMDSRLRGNDEDISVRAFADQAERAARLCKADLVTGMVGEFPELQGIMGGYYARAQGESDAVADAIRDHYKPVGQGDDVPTAPVTVAVSLADKLDTLTQFFLIDEAPTGSKDPFALRRASLGIISLILSNSLRFRLESVLFKAVEDDLEKFQVVWDGHLELKLSAFFADRLKVQQREAGVRHDLIDAVFSLGGEDDLVRLLARVKALQAYITTAEGANLLAAYKRAANILKQAESSSPSTRDGEGDRSAQPRGGVPS